MFAGLSFVLANAGPKPHIVSISIFKNGYAFVTREMDTEPGINEFPSLGRVTDGTIWFYTPKEVHVDSITGTNVKSTASSPARTLLDLLRANVGKSVTVELGGSEKPIPLTGRLLSVSDQLVAIQTASGKSIVQVQNVTAVHGGADVAERLDEKIESQIIRIKTSGAAGKLRFTTLEPGIMWSPTYAVKVVDSKTLSLVARASVWNELEDVSGASVRFVTGFPNVGALGSLDMMSARDFGQFAGLGMNDLAVNPSTIIGGTSNSGTVTLNSAAPVGGMAVTMPATVTGAAGETSGKRGITTVDSSGFSRVDYQNSNIGIRGNGATVEDLYFFNQPNVDLLKGEKGLFSLSTASATYERLHTTTVSDEDARSEGSSIDVWQTLRFKNPSDRPCSGGTASIFENSELMGQDTMDYIPPHGDIELRVSQAKSVVVEAKERETARDRAALQISKNHAVDKLTLTGSIVITNHKLDAVKIKVTRSVTGEVMSQSGGKFTSTARGTIQRNPTGQIVWTVSVAAGKSLTLSYKYSQFAND